MSDARPPARASRTALAAVASAAGLALLVWQIRTVGLDTIRADLAAVGWGFLAILALSLLRFVVRSIAWTTLIGERVPVTSALAASIGGDALGNITPLSLLVSEPAKALYVGGRVHTALSVTSLLLGLLSLLAFRAAWRQLRAAIARPTHVTDAFEFSGDLSTAFERERHRYSLTNPIFAGAFEACNLRRRWDPTSRSTRWSASLRNRVLAVVCFAALGFWLITWIER